jgi:pimeloyl-ACP methyl ester carboxylesterase
MSIIQRKGRKFKLFFTVITGLYLLVGLGLYMFQENMIFIPSRLDQDYQFSFDYHFEEIFLRANDGANINALYFEAKKPRGVILYFHGNAGNLARWGDIVSPFIELNYDVFVMDYRTYGKSTGSLSENALYKDAQLCYDYLTRDYDEKDIIVYGRSLGTGIASNLASQNNLKLLILETPYYNLMDIGKHRFPMYPFGQMLKYKFPSNEFLKKVKCPVIMFHGTDDDVIPISSAEKLFSELNSDQVEFHIIENAGHNNLIDFVDFRNQIEAILY